MNCHLPITLLALLLVGCHFHPITPTSQTVRVRVEALDGRPLAGAEVSRYFPATNGLTAWVKENLDDNEAFGWGYWTKTDGGGVAELEVRTTNFGRNNLGTDQVTGSPVAFSIKTGDAVAYLLAEALYPGRPVTAEGVRLTPMSIGPPTRDKIIARRERDSERAKTKAN